MFRELISIVWAHRRARMAIGGVTAAVCVTVGGWLIYDHFASIPPDPEHAPAGRVVDFFMGRHFDRLSEADRQAYLRAMLQRYAVMDEQQRAALDEHVRQQQQSDSDRMRERMIGVWKDFVVSEARQYLDVPPERRDQWLDRRLAAWRMLGFPGAGGNRDESGRPDHLGEQADRRSPAQAFTPERQQRVVRFFEEEVIPRTTARDRAMVTLLVRDVMERQR